MSEEQDRSVGEQPDRDVPVGGERLARARREQRISVLEVAKELHLDEPKVRALERNDFEMLGAPVFAKGHLRKYAQLVGVDEADVFADYYSMTRAAALPPLVVGRKKARQEFSPGPWIALLAVLIVAAGGYWWFVERDSGAPPIQAQPDASPPEQQQPEQPQPEQPQAEEPRAEEPRAEEPQAEELEPDEVFSDNAPAAAAVEQTLPEGQISLALRFSGECWTEISDADGRRLFFNMGHNGQTADIRGKAPLSALFGNADNVSVQVNGGDYVLPEPSSASRTVRVAIVSP